MNQMTYTALQKDAEHLSVPDSCVLEFACAHSGRTPHRDWTMLFEYFNQLDNDQVPSDLRQDVRRLSHGILHWIESGALIGPVATPSKGFGSLSLFEGENNQGDWEGVPFSSEKFSILLGKLESFSQTIPAEYARFGEAFFNWIMERRTVGA